MLSLPTLIRCISYFRIILMWDTRTRSTDRPVEVRKSLVKTVKSRSLSWNVIYVQSPLFYIYLPTRH